MQPIIDIILQLAHEQIGYFDRGSYANSDFKLGDLIEDGAFHELDLSGIVPVGTRAVALRMKFKGSATGISIRLRPHGTTSVNYTCVARTQIALIINNANPVIGVSSDRKIDYSFSSDKMNTFDMVVRGWWLR